MQWVTTQSCSSKRWWRAIRWVVTKSGASEFLNKNFAWREIWSGQYRSRRTPARWSSDFAKSSPSVTPSWTLAGSCRGIWPTVCDTSNTCSDNLHKVESSSSEELHAELCYAECLLVRAALAFFQDDNFASFIKGALRIRSCYQIYRYRILQHPRFCERDHSASKLQGSDIARGWCWMTQFG